VGHVSPVTSLLSRIDIAFVLGPFPKPSILQWRAQGFFGGMGGSPEKVELRKIGGDSEWLSFWKLFG
jgi:hypothetical protein